MKSTTKRCTLKFGYDDLRGFTWSRGGRSNYVGTIGGGGYDSFLGMLLDVDLLRVLEHDIGVGTIPKEIVDIAKRRAARERKNRVPIPQSVIDGLRALGYPVEVKRKSNRRKP